VVDSAVVTAERGPIVVVGGHAGALFMHVTAVPKEGETMLAWGYEEPEDGGKATNQAIAAARLGAPSVFVTVIGDDDRGRRARASLETAGVDTRWVVEAAGPTDVGFLMLPPSKIPAITTAQERSRELTPDVVGRARETIASASYVVCQLEAPQETALATFRIAREAGVTTVLNPAPADTLDDELVALTDLLVPNEHEAAALLASDDAPATLAERLAARHRHLDVIVTAGAAGAYVVRRGEHVAHVPAPEVDEVVDTTGAGDAFVGALVVRLREGDGLLAAARFAVRAAAVSITRPGTIPAFPRLEDVTAAAGAV
jgi:ribokinase